MRKRTGKLTALPERVVSDGGGRNVQPGGGTRTERELAASSQ